MKIQDQVINYVVDKIRREFPENIALLLCYGSYINGTANEKSDVDMYFIPRDEKGFELSETFILKGIGYDIFGMSWDRAEAIANFQESLSPLVGDAKIIYSHSDDEVNRFRQLQQHMKGRLADKIYVQPWV